MSEACQRSTQVYAIEADGRNCEQWNRHSTLTHKSAPPPHPNAPSPLPPTATKCSPRTDLDQQSVHAKDMTLDTGCTAQ